MCACVCVCVSQCVNRLCYPGGLGRCPPFLGSFINVGKLATLTQMERRTADLSFQHINLESVDEWRNLATILASLSFGIFRLICVKCIVEPWRQGRPDGNNISNSNNNSNNNCIRA